MSVTTKRLRSRDRGTTGVSAAVAVCVAAGVGGVAAALDLRGAGHYAGAALVAVVCWVGAPVLVESTARVLPGTVLVGGIGVGHAVALRPRTGLGGDWRAVLVTYLSPLSGAILAAS